MVRAFHPCNSWLTSVHHGGVQTKVRNRLSDDALDKLVYIRTNNNQFMKQERKQQADLGEPIDSEGSDSDSNLVGSSVK
jgi:hypothetical protein